MKKICLTECVHYLTGIDKDELNNAIYCKEPYIWKDNLFKLLNEKGFNITRKYKCKKQCIAVMDYYKEEKLIISHSIVRNNGVELNPYVINLDNYVFSYFLIIKRKKGKLIIK